MRYSAHYQDYVLPFGVIELPEALHRLGHTMFGASWTGQESSLPVLEDALKTVLVQYSGQELLDRLLNFFTKKKQELARHKSTLLDVRDQQESMESSLWQSLLISEPSKQSLRHNLKCAVVEYDTRCFLYQKWADVLLAYHEGCYTLNSSNILAYRRYYAVETLLRQILHSGVIETYLLHPDTGALNPFTKEAWLAKEAHILYNTGDVAEGRPSIVQGIALVNDKQCTMFLQRMALVERERGGFTSGTALTFEEIRGCTEADSAITQGEKDTLLRTVAVSCALDYQRAHQRLPKKQRLCELTLTAVKKEFPEVFAGYHTAEAVARRIKMEEIRQRCLQHEEQKCSA